MAYKNLTKAEKREIAEHCRRNYREELREIREHTEYPTAHKYKHDIESHSRAVEKKLKEIAGF